MKLQTKLVLFATVSTLIIALLMVLLLPVFVKIIADRNTNAALAYQKTKVLGEIRQNGIDHYLQGDSSYGSYSMLKDQYISIEPSDESGGINEIKTEQRIIDNDTINYRIITQYISISGNNYLIEIGRKASSINEDSRELQKMALYVLLGLVLLTLLTNIGYTRHLLKPLNNIINTKLVNKKFPFKDSSQPVKTSTYDFKYLDNTIAGLMEQINVAFKKEREFSSNASHELMTPISIIQSKLENMMSDENVNEGQVEKIEDIMRTLNRLKKITKSLLLISRIENEQYIRSDEANVHTLLNEVEEELSHRLEQKNLKWTCDVDESVVLKNVNKELLFHLFFNLINNAIKYNKQNGSIEITDELIPQKQYAIFIKDTGIGIPENQLPYIFDRFKKTATSREDSNGLGLSIVWSIAQYHHAGVRVSSQASDGSVFKIIFFKEHL